MAGFPNHLNQVNNLFMKFNELNSVAEQYNIGKGGKDGWLSLEVGDNKIRIVSDYEVLVKHWANKKVTICVGKEHGCVFCAEPAEKDGKKDKPSAKFLMWCIDRKDGQLKIAEVGWSVVKAIADLQQDAEYGFPDLPPYDINVKKTVKGSGAQPSDTEYTVIAGRTNVELTADELSAMAKLTPMKEVVDSMKAKTLKGYQEMGLIPPTPSTPEGTPPAEPGANDAPSFLQPNA